MDKSIFSIGNVGHRSRLFLDWDCEIEVFEAAGLIARWNSEFVPVKQKQILCFLCRRRA